MDSELERLPLSQGELNQLVRNLGKGKCVLFLGAGLDLCSGGQRFNLANRLSRALARRLEADYDESVAETSNLPHVAQRLVNQRDSNIAVLRTTVQEFFLEHEDASTDDPVFTGLAQLPFRLIVTNRHDRTFERYLKAQRKDPQAAFYRRDTQVHRLDEGTVKKPVVYYLAGKLDSLDSLVISDHDVLEFLGAVVSQNPSLPKSITAEVSDPSTMLLLAGFEIRRCYTRLLLSALGRHDGTHPSVAFGESEDDRRAADKGAEHFFKTEFQIQTRHTKSEVIVRDLLDKWIGADKPQPVEAEDASAGSFVGSSVPVRVFISYCRADRSAANDLCRTMQKAGMEPFLDTERLEGGDAWDSVVRKEIRESDYFVLLLSEQLRKKNRTEVNSEVKIASKVQDRFGSLKFIIPVSLDGTAADDCNLPDHIDLNRFHLHETIRSETERKALVSLIVRNYQERGL